MMWIQPRQNTQSAAFTLVELLIVISIVTLLMAILLPVMGSARDSARSVMCMNHQKQLGIATNAYINDYSTYLPQPVEDGDIPDAAGSTTSATAKKIQGSALWFNALDYYLLQKGLAYSNGNSTNRNYTIFKQDPVWQTFDASVQDTNRTIKMNGYLGDSYDDLNGAQPGMSPNDWKFFRESEIPRQAATVMFFDGRALDTPSVTTGSVDTAGGSLFHGQEIYVALRHANRSANVIFVDAHGENVAEDARDAGSGYLGWYNAVNGAPQHTQKLNWFHLGRNGVNDN